MNPSIGRKGTFFQTGKELFLGLILRLQPRLWLCRFSACFYFHPSSLLDYSWTYWSTISFWVWTEIHKSKQGLGEVLSRCTETNEYASQKRHINVRKKKPFLVVSCFSCICGFTYVDILNAESSFYIKKGVVFPSLKWVSTVGGRVSHGAKTKTNAF